MLIDVINGRLIGNNCSNNNGNGISLYGSQNSSILGSIADENEGYGIYLEDSHNNTLLGNNVNNNYYYILGYNIGYGIELEVIGNIYENPGMLKL